MVVCSTKSPDFVAIPIGNNDNLKIRIKLYRHIVVGTKSGDFAQLGRKGLAQYLAKFCGLCLGNRDCFCRFV
jgi:hypothetical protein